jgi:hypothetical protein
MTMTDAPPPTAPPSTLGRVTTHSDIAFAQRRPQLNLRAAITGAVFPAISGLAIWYLARPEPLLVRSEVQSTRIDIAARVSGRLAKTPVEEGEVVTPGMPLISLVNLTDTWLGFSLHEDLIEGLI